MKFRDYIVMTVFAFGLSYLGTYLKSYHFDLEGALDHLGNLTYLWVRSFFS